MKRKIKNIMSGYDYKELFWDWLFATLGAILTIISIDVFLVPAQLSPGGVTGIAIILKNFTGLPIGSLMLILNIPMLFLGFYYLGRFKFLIRTAYVVLFYNLGVDLARPWLPPITDDLLLNALYSAVVGGIGSGLIYRGRATAAGTGVLSRVIQLKTGIPLSQMYLFIDGSVVLANALVYGWEVGLYSLLTLFVWGLVTDYVLEGPSVIRTAFIVTDSADEVAEAVFHRMGIGLTGWSGQGMFTHSEHTILFCTINRPDVNALQAVITDVDPQAFIVIGQGHSSKGGILRSSKAIRDSSSTQQAAPNVAAEAQAGQ